MVLRRLKLLCCYVKECRAMKETVMTELTIFIAEAEINHNNDVNIAFKLL